MNKEELHSFIEKQQPNICQIVASMDKQIVYSDTWNDYKKDDCTHIMSATKSIMALLVGIAIDKGQIGSVDDKVLEYFPDYKVKRGEKTIYDVTIRHLLTMRADCGLTAKAGGFIEHREGQFSAVITFDKQ